MIYSVRGKIAFLDMPWLGVITPGGVTYEIECTQQAINNNQVNDEIEIFTQMIVREDAQLLYGFGSREERDVFKTLIKVSGVGPKMAINLLSSLSMADLVLAIQNKAPQMLLNCKGVGKKVAEKIVVECQNRFSNWVLPTATSPKNIHVSRPHQDALAALLALGYRQPQIMPQLEKALEVGVSETSELVKFVLSELQPQ